ncbi:MLO-like protein 1 isoform X1 [Musa acuminata AAA Group]|uniref:MLO-like protein 1 isoform X1 n=1 Tax=Musa acuminata AAA Group TaxID=214697 RepID=UPI0031D45B49
MAERGDGGERGGMEEVDDAKLEFTPTWIVAGVCSVIIFISLVAERYLHYLGKVLKRKNQKPLFNALQKVKEELMLLGFISLLLTVFQEGIQNICIPKRWTLYMLPCNPEKAPRHHHHHHHHHHRVYSAEIPGGGGERRLLAEGVAHCMSKGEVPLLSVEAIHQLHIFIFVLAVTHVLFSAFIVLLGGAKISQWKHWEDSIQQEIRGVAPTNNAHLHQFQFIMERVKTIERDSVDVTWLHSFFKQFFLSVTKSDYVTLRLIFIMTHCKGHPKFDFHKYMIRAFESDFKKVVGISWHLWAYVIIFLLLNINGWHTYFWIAFVPLILLLSVGTKLEHVITEIAHNVAEKYFAIGGDLIVMPSDDYFWFHRPRILLFLIHLILFQNAFDIAFIFWLFTPYGLDSCITDHFGFAVPRLVIGIIVQLLCSYSTLPLYAIVTQMGTHFKKTVFDDNVRGGLVDWAQKAKKRLSLKEDNELGGSSNGRNESPKTMEMTKLIMQSELMMEQGKKT